jgi:hypothetical protein
VRWPNGYVGQSDSHPLTDASLAKSFALSSRPNFGRQPGVLASQHSNNPDASAGTNGFEALSAAELRS